MKLLFASFFIICTVVSTPVAYTMDKSGQGLDPDLEEFVRSVVYFDAENNCRIRELYKKDRECTVEELDAVLAVLEQKPYVKKSEPMYDNALIDFICDGEDFKLETCEFLASVDAVAISTGTVLLLIPPTAPAGVAILAITAIMSAVWIPVRFLPPCESKFCGYSQRVFGVK